MKRYIEIMFIDGSSKRINLSKATFIKSDIGMMHLDKLPDGNWRLIFSQDFVDDFSKIDNLKIIREN